MDIYSVWLVLRKGRVKNYYMKCLKLFSNSKWVLFNIHMEKSTTIIVLFWQERNFLTWVRLKFKIFKSFFPNFSLKSPIIPITNTTHLMHHKILQMTILRKKKHKFTAFSIFISVSCVNPKLIKKLFSWVKIS